MLLQGMVHTMARVVVELSWMMSLALGMRTDSLTAPTGA